MQATGSTFKTAEPLLGDLLRDIETGALQLPDFQRGWVWDDIHIRSLLASVSLSQPIGAVMLLEAGGKEIHFKPRLVEGVPSSVSEKPDRYILDGQQRLTSLYLAMRSGKPVPTKTEKGAKTDRLYFLDMAQCLDEDADRMDAVVSVQPDRMLKSDFGRRIDLDLSSQEKEFENRFFPVSLIYDTPGLTEWMIGFQEFNNHDPEVARFLARFQAEVWMCFQQYKVPVIELLKQTSKVAVCQVFEKVNTGGVVLSVFELVTATFAADDFPLRDDWRLRKGRLHERPVLKAFDATAFLTATTLLTSYQRHRSSRGAVGCKRKDVLQLKLDDYQNHASQIEQGLGRAARLLAREKVFDARNLPYSTQLVPLSAICAFLGNQVEEEPVKNKLARWYWCGVFGELYGGANESRFAFDMPEVIGWINGGEEPRTVRDAAFSPVRLLSLQTRQSAAYKGLMARLMTEGSRDFLSGDPLEINSYFDLSIDIHHIFPRTYCQKLGYPDRKWNSIVNKAPISAHTNRSLGGNAPSDYISRIESDNGLEPDRLDEILRSHQINPLLLRNDEFDHFIRDRATKLLDLIEAAIGKKISGRDSEEVVHEFGAVLTSAGSQNFAA